MSEEKFYRIKTKEDAHLNDKLKDDGSRAAIQFDRENNLQGPVDLIEVDESEYPTRDVYVEVEKEDRSFGQVILEDAVAPAVADALTVLLTRAVEAGIDAFGNWMSQKVIPAAKARGSELVEKKRQSKTTDKIELSETAVSVKEKNEVASAPEKRESNTVIHTQQEVDQILNNMKFAALYIAAGIRELSNTVIADDGTDSERMLEMQSKLKELSSEDITRTIEFMLQDQNRDMMDQATVQLFEAFRNKKIIVNGESVPISKFLSAESEEK